MKIQNNYFQKNLIEQKKQFNDYQNQKHIKPLELDVSQPLRGNKLDIKG